MDKLQKDISNYIERLDLYGRSFTRAVAFIQMVESDYFFTDDTAQLDDMEWAMAEAHAYAMDGDAVKVHENLTLKQLVQVSDIALIDELIEAYIYGESEEE